MHEHLHVDEGRADLELDQDPDRDHDDRAGEGAQGAAGGPAPLVALGDRQQKQQEGDAEGQRAEEVGASAGLVPGCRDQEDDGEQGEHREAGRHPEGVAVVGVGAGGEQARGDEREPAAERQGAADQGHGAGQLLRPYLFAQDGKGQREDRGGGALEHPAQDQQRQRARDRGDHGARDHDDEHGHQGGLLAVLVAEAAEQRGEDGGGQQCGGGHPAHIGGRSAEVAPDQAQDRDGQGLHHRYDHGRQAQGEDDDRLVPSPGGGVGGGCGVAHGWRDLLNASDRRCLITSSTSTDGSSRYLRQSSK